MQKSSIRVSLFPISTFSLCKAEFGKIKPEMVASLLEPALMMELEHLYPSIIAKHKPGLWDRLPEQLKTAVIARGHDSAKKVVKDFMLDMQVGSCVFCVTIMVTRNGAPMSFSIFRTTAPFMSAQSRLDELVDVKELITKHFLSNPKELVEMFIQCGYQELMFIRNSGATLGFLFGTVQMVNTGRT